MIKHRPEGKSHLLFKCECLRIFGRNAFKSRPCARLLFTTGKFLQKYVDKIHKSSLVFFLNKNVSLVLIFCHTWAKKAPFYQAKIWILWAIYIFFLSFLCFLVGDGIEDDWCVVAEAVLMLRFTLPPAQTLLFVPLLNEPKVNACRIQSGGEISWD